MPMLKLWETPNGVDCSFHKAVSGEYSFRDGVVVIRVGSWVNQAKHDAGAGVVSVIPVTLPIAMAADVEVAMVVDQASPFFGAEVVPDTPPAAPSTPEVAPAE